ncbi:uncharacterized protein LOC126368998 [Pectinophora gossypiella]|uniref:uncharacterized protein LOC126368998 n=1 Tax=Pectinophora gossypiella TaxID=13191 RepID=UPI00214E4EF1|nr:uncharacterized protein LOC126368998 [Pectinophora gossypiella]
MSDKEQLDKLLKRRRTIKAKVTSFENYLKLLLSCEKITDLQRIDLDGRFSKFIDVYPEFDKLQTEIEILSDTPDVMFSYREQLEAQYHTLMAQARILLEKVLEPQLQGGSDRFHDADAEPVPSTCLFYNKESNGNPLQVTSNWAH